jgi:predicted DNA-binding protein
MPTKKRRLNVTLSPKLEKAIGQIAEQESVPQATVLVRLAEDALELNEDYILAEIVERRIAENPNPTFISHEKFWGKAV